MYSKQKLDSLNRYDSTQKGRWTRREATHLLWRTGFGATIEEIENATRDGLDKTLDRILTPQKERSDFDSIAPSLRSLARDTGNIADLKAWWLYRMLYSTNPLVEKMSLFWHNHFATSYAKVNSVIQMGAQNDLIRKFAVGDFRQLLHGMTTDVAMLVWLDGNANRKRHPNENFAREVMELFSLGVGNYSEEDIQQAARTFTGWHVRDSKFWFNRLQHDSGKKQLFNKSGNLNGDDVVNLCLQHAACPRFIAVKLLRFFVMPNPDPKSIDQLAGSIRKHNFDMRKALRDLFASENFFAVESRRSIIKSPIDLVLGSYRALECRANLQTTARLLAELGQDIFEPPSVKGWEGGRLWVNSATLLQRTNFAAELSKGNRFGRIQDPIRFTTAQGWSGDNAIIRSYVNLLLSRDLEPSSVSRLRQFLSQAEGSSDQRLRNVLQLILSMPEFQLS